MSEASNQDLLPSGSAAGGDSFEDNWKSFLEHDFGGEVNAIENQVDPTKDEPAAPEPKPQGADTQAAPVQDTLQGGQGNDTLVAASGNDTISASGQDSAAAPASKDVLEGGAGQDEVDQKLLARMLGLGTPEAKPAEPAPAAPGSSGASPVASSDGSSEELFMPFQPTFKLQPELVSALFEADDVETRHQALVGLLSAFGNAVCATIQKQQKEVWQPEIQASFTTRAQAETVGAAINQDFYSAFPELQDYKAAVKRAFQVMHETLGNKPYDEQVRNQVGALARKAVEAAGIKLPARGQQQQQQQQVPNNPAPAAPPKANTPFEAGGSRPEMGGGDNSPAALVEQLSQW